MKKILALLVLVTGTARANELSEAWDNFGRDTRAIYGAKALFTGFLAYASAMHVHDQWKKGLKKVRHLGDLLEWEGGVKKIGKIVHRGIVSGFSCYAVYLFLKQAYYDAKQLAVQKEDTQEKPLEKVLAAKRRF